MPWEQTSEVIRSGHRDVDEFQPDTMRTIWISEAEGIKAVVGKPKGKDSMEVVSYLFMLDSGWTVEKAREWFKKHKEEPSREKLFCLTPILEKTLDNPLRIRGVALTAGMSRNLNIYLDDELAQFAERLVGVPVYLEHVSALNAVGKVTNAFWDKDARALLYEAEIYDEKVAEQIRRGLIQHVSVAADYTCLDVVDGQIPRGLHNAELSLVAVPGISNSNVQIMERLASARRFEEALEAVNASLRKVAYRLELLEKQNRIEEAKKLGITSRAVIVPEARTEMYFNLSKVRLRDIMNNIS